MRAFVRIAVLVVLGAATWKVHSVRSRIAAEDADPAAVQRLAKTLGTLPLDLQDGKYRGERLEIDEEIVRGSGADSYSSTLYADQRGNRFQLYVGGSIKNQENFHAPSYCMPSSGWEILEQTVVPFRVYACAEPTAQMRRLLLQHGLQQKIVYYWFQAGARVADHEWTIRYYRFLDLLADEPLRPTLIVTVYADVRSDIAHTEASIAEFLSTVGPVLEERIGLESDS